MKRSVAFRKRSFAVGHTITWQQIAPESKFNSVVLLHLIIYLFPKRALEFNKNSSSPVNNAKQVLSIGRGLCDRAVNCYAARYTGEM